MDSFIKLVEWIQYAPAEFWLVVVGVSLLCIGLLGLVCIAPVLLSWRGDWR
jgi:hypothetical protein